MDNLPSAFEAACAIWEPKVNPACLWSGHEWEEEWDVFHPVPCRRDGCPVYRWPSLE